LLGDHVLPLAAVDRLIRKGGAPRVSEDAVIALTEVLEEEGIKISQQATEFASHANRKTIVGADIKLALKQMK